MKNFKILILILTLVLLIAACKGTDSSSDNSGDQNAPIEKNEALAPEELIHKYYNLMSNRDTLNEAYELSTKKVDYEKFYSWYKDVKEVNVGEIESLGDDRYRFDIIMLEQPVWGIAESFYFHVTMRIKGQRIIESESKAIEDISPFDKEIIKVDTENNPFKYFDNLMTDEDAPIITVEGIEYYILGEGDGKQILVERKEPYLVKYADKKVKNIGDKFFLRDQTSGELDFYRSTRLLAKEDYNEPTYFVCKKNSAYYAEGNILTIGFLDNYDMNDFHYTEQVAMFFSNKNDNVVNLSVPSRSNILLKGLSPDNIYCIIYNSGAIDFEHYSKKQKIKTPGHYTDKKLFNYKPTGIQFITWSQYYKQSHFDWWCAALSDGIITTYAVVLFDKITIFDVKKLRLTQYDHLLNPEYGLLFYSEYNPEDKEFILFMYNLSDESKIVISSSNRPFKPYFKDRDTLMYFSPEVDGFVEYKMPVIN